MSNISLPKNRLGLHYFPDDLHYRDKDLQTWIPEIQALGAAWITLISSAERAIPEGFLSGLISSGIEPILHFPLTARSSNPEEGLDLLFANYARWGVRYVALFDRPNTRQAWTYTTWIQSDLVERFLDIFLPLAEQAQQAGLIPVFPPLEPGGDYWDTAFLQSALRGIERRGHTRLLDSLGISAYAWTYNRLLNWGAGGPERWPNAQPYRTPAGSEDQIGFRIFDWYDALIQAELGSSRPILVLRAGSWPGDDEAPLDYKTHTYQNLTIAQSLNPKLENMVSAQKQPGLLLVEDSAEALEPFPDALVALNFWLLAAEKSNPNVPCAWYQPDGSALPVVSAMKQWAAKPPETTNLIQGESQADPILPHELVSPSDPENSLPAFHPINHYFLLPLYAWGVADWDLDAIIPIIRQYHPTVGFSIHEACLASRVTIVGNHYQLSQETLKLLHDADCIVERLDQNGIFLAI